MKRAPTCGAPYEKSLGWDFSGAKAVYRGSAQVPCTKPAGHPGRTRTSTGQYTEDHGARYEGPHGQTCECGCHDAPYCVSCDDCWPEHIAPDACLTCAKAIKDAGHDPTDGEHYLVLIFPQPQHDHDYWAKECRVEDAPHGWIKFGS